MAENTFGAFIRFDPAIVDQDEPVGTDIARTLVENALFVSESCSQVRVKWIAPSQSDEIAPAGTIIADRYAEVFRTTIDVHPRPGGGAFRFRVRLAGRANQTASTTFRLAVGHPLLVSSQAVLSSIPSNVAEYTTSATSSAWLSATGGTTLLTVADGEAESSIVPQETVVSIGGAATSVPVMRLAVEVWVKTANAANTPQLAGLVVEEYIGT